MGQREIKKRHFFFFKQILQSDDFSWTIIIFHDSRAAVRPGWFDVILSYYIHIALDSILIIKAWHSIQTIFIFTEVDITGQSMEDGELNEERIQERKTIWCIMGKGAIVVVIVW